MKNGYDDFSPWRVKKGFKVEKFIGGLSLPVNICFAPQIYKNDDPSFIYVNELYGNVKVITKNNNIKILAENLLNYKPNYQFPGTGESGLIGITADQKSGDIFVSLIYEKNGMVFNKVINIKTEDGLSASKYETIMDGISSIKAAHQIQALTIGPDNKLYVNLGDGMESKSPQNDNDLRGKVLRMNLDGSIPDDNPWPNRYVYAKGFRNPFGADWRNSDGHLYVSDNGPAFDDRLVKVEAGKNYGWPKSMRTGAIHIWERTEAPTGIAFMQGNQFPNEYSDHLFVALFGKAWHLGITDKGKKIIEFILDSNGKVLSHGLFMEYIGEGPASVAGLAFGPDGLYFSDLHGEDPKNKHAGNIYRITTS